MRLRLTLLLACCLLAACNKINQQNYAQLKTGMERSEVERLLGSPDACSGALGMSSCTWGDDSAYISVQFAGDKVVMFAGQGLK